MKIISSLSIVLMSIFSLSTLASNYPSDYSWNSTCKENGPLRVCRAIQTTGYAALDIYYHGTLTNSGLQFWVQVNYLDGARQGLFASQSVDFRAEASYVRITGGCLVGTLGGCAKEGSAEMRSLLTYAQQPYNYRLNALDLNIAVVNKLGEWDNNGVSGGSYHFQFEEK